MTSSPLTPSHPHPSKTLETPLPPPPAGATPIPIPWSLGVYYRLLASTSPVHFLQRFEKDQKIVLPNLHFQKLCIAFNSYTSFAKSLTLMLSLDQFGFDSDVLTLVRGDNLPHPNSQTRNGRSSGTKECSQWGYLPKALFLSFFG
ncbi:hypothetical protein ACFX15_027990 [Malus domestica]